MNTAQALTPYTQQFSPERTSGWANLEFSPDRTPEKTGSERIRDVLQSGEWMRTRDISEKAEVNPEAVSTLLSVMVKDGRIQRRGERKAFEYHA